MGKSATRDNGQRSSCKWTIRKLFAISCFISVALDPLLLYIVMMKEDNKCLLLDNKMKIIALLLRSLADLPYLLALLVHLRNLVRAAQFGTRFGRIIRNVDSSANQTRASRRIREVKVIARTFREPEIAMNTLAVLPIPQIVILVFFPTMGGSRSSLNKMTILNLVIMFQYVPRVRPIYRFCKDLNKTELDKKTIPKGVTKIWVPGAVNFIMYILASHVVGAFWYFFSIQRQMECWAYGCRSENGCEISSFYCDASAFRNVTLLNDLCPINPANITIFDFGIYLDALQSGILGSTDFPQKFLQCFSWGLRNLSSFASNLRSSSYAWESLFVVFISISGLLLFIYLLGHLQTFMQATDRTSRIWRKMQTIYPEIKSMSFEYGLPVIQFDIYELVEKRLEQDENLDVDNIFSILPWELKKLLKRHLFLATLKSKVTILQGKHREVLNAILKHLEPVNYPGGSYIIREGEPLDMMFFVTQGAVLTYQTNRTGGGSGSPGIIRPEKGGFYGQGLITWAAKSPSSNGLPISEITVKSHKKVEVFVIMATDLETIVSKFSRYFKDEHPPNGW